MLLFLCVLTSNFLLASIYCPPDVTVDCHTDIDNIHITGQAVPGGSYHGWQPKYEDWGSVQNCGSGYITRKWFIDLNHNGKFDNYEPNCHQSIHIVHSGGDVSIEWPEDIYLNCDDAVPDSNPWVSHGPCDLIAISKEDVFFDISDGVCSKIFRNFTVINWCVYEPGGSEGIYTHTQRIFFEDSEPPVIDLCPDITLSTTDCKGEFTVSNSAFDTGFCFSETLRWIVEVDINSNGSVDFEYDSNITSGQFFIEPTSNDELVTITLPEVIGIGWHRLTWKVFDGCGNADICIQNVKMADTQPPTPICFNNLSTVLMPPNGTVTLTIDNMVKEAFDNCTFPEHIQLSFTPELGTTTMKFDCENEGVEMVRLYAIDQFGNANFCKVMILFQDNGGACPGMRAYSGEILNANGEGIEDVQMNFLESDGDLRDQVMSDASGEFVFEDTQLSSSLDLYPEKQSNPSELTVLDLIMLKDYLLGETELNETAQYLADINQDGQVGFSDLVELRQTILFEDDPALIFSHWSASRNEYVFKSKWSLWEAADKDVFYGFQMGDVSPDYSQEILTDFEIDYRTGINLNSKIENGFYNIYLDAKTCINGLELKLNVDDVSRLAGGVLMDEHMELQEGDGYVKFLWLSDQCESFHADTPIISFDLGSDHAANIEMIGQNHLVKDNLHKEYVIALQREHQIEQTSDQTFDIRANNKLINIYPSHDESYDYQVFDMSGRVVLSSNNVVGVESIKLFNAASGIYYIRVNYKNEQISTGQRVFLD